MRAILLLPCLVLAACSDAAPPPEKAEAPPAEQIQAGQWEMTSEVTNVTQRDKGTPALKMAVGSKSVTSSCIAEADVKRPPAAMFVPEGFKCDYRDSYMRGGRVNLTLACTYDGQTGDVPIAISGSYTADSIEATSTAETRFSGEGDVKLETKLTGRRTGACTPAPAKG